MPSATDINVVALFKKATGERYVFLFDDASRAVLLRTLGRFAANPELSLTWYDAAVLSKRIREQDKPPLPSGPRFTRTT